MDVRYDEAKFTELLVYVADRLRNDRAGGATKLNKVLFFAEFTHLRRHHAVISGCEFQKLPHGPGPRQLLPVRRRVLAAGEAELIEEDFLGRPQQRLVPRRAADLSVFTEVELASIDDVLEQLEGMTGTQVSKLSHHEPGWRLTEIGETIPFATAFLDFPQVATEVSTRLESEVAECYGFADAG
ncbi:MAG: Panacea domain-containing protein [Acidimicrobiales bacterium]